MKAIPEENLFLKEIKSQPDILLDMIQKYRDEDYKILKNIIFKIQDTFFLDKMRRIRKIIFLGMGSSYFASLLAVYFFNSEEIHSKLKMDCEAIDAGEFLYYYNLNDSDVNTLVIFVSQSGESGELVEIVNNLNKNRFPKNNIWTITNTHNSFLDKNSEFTIFLQAGEERSVTNKTYLCSLSIIYLISSLIFDVSNTIIAKKENIEENFHQIVNRFEILAEKWKNATYEIKEYIENWEFNAEKIMEFIQISGLSSIDLKPKYPEFINFISRGTSLSTAGQSALNIKEVSKIYAESISCGMFRHGPIESIKSSFRAVIFSNSEKDRDSVNQLIKNITETWCYGKVILITNDQDQIDTFKENLRICCIKYDIIDPYVAPLFEIIPVQILFYTLAQKRGVLPGSFKYTTKITKKY